MSKKKKKVKTPILYQEWEKNKDKLILLCCYEGCKKEAVFIEHTYAMYYHGINGYCREDWVYDRYQDIHRGVKIREFIWEYLRQKNLLEDVINKVIELELWEDWKKPSTGLGKILG